MRLRNKVVLTLVLAVVYWLCMQRFASAKQLQPEPKRVREIQAALVSHGFSTRVPTGKWDLETLAVLRKIADERHWQVNHVPDARVLILLGLGNIHSDPWVAEQPGNRLDKAQRGEE